MKNTTHNATPATKVSQKLSLRTQKIFLGLATIVALGLIGLGMTNIFADEVVNTMAMENTYLDVNTYGKMKTSPETLASIGSASRTVVGSEGTAINLAVVQMAETRIATRTTNNTTAVTAVASYEPQSAGGYSGRAYGSAGRVRVPSVGIDTGLNYASGYDPAGAQAVVNAGDSAALFDFSGTNFIADHASQGFGAIIGLPVGSIVCIDNPDGSTSTYSVVSSFQGINNGYISFGDGTAITNGLLTLYTCLDASGYNIWVVQVQ